MGEIDWVNRSRKPATAARTLKWSFEQWKNTPLDSLYQNPSPQNCVLIEEISSYDLGNVGEEAHILLEEMDLMAGKGLDRLYGSRTDRTLARYSKFLQIAQIAQALENRED